MNSKLLTVVLIIFGLLISALITRNGDLAWMILPFLAYLGAGILQMPDVENLCLNARRTLSETRSEEGVTVAVGVTVQNQGIGMVHLMLCDPLQPAMKIMDGGLRQSVSLRAGEETELKYTFRAARGSFAWKTIQVVVSDPFGLIETELGIPASAELQICPEIKKFKPILMRPRSTLHVPGSIPARLGGSGTDFWGVREYQPGDALRRLDWRLTARHPHKLFTKEFEQEEIADIGLILDARQNTDLWIGEDHLFEHGVGAMSSLAEMFLRQGHRVGMLVFGDSMLTVFPNYGKMQLNRIMRCLAKASIGIDSSLARLEFLPIRLFPSRSLIVMLSPLAPDDWSFFPRLRAYGYQVLLISPNPIDFAIKTLAQDPLSCLAQRAARLERHLKLRKINQLQIPVIDWQVNQPLYPLVRNALSHTRGQREL